MSFDKVEIPYGVYWSTPFAKWQGSLQHLHAMKFAAWVAKNELGARGIDPAAFDTGVFGMTNTQYQSFYGAPWPLFEMGAKTTPGHMITQVCATGARVAFAAASVSDAPATKATPVSPQRASGTPTTAISGASRAAISTASTSAG